jgi:hypothetical protein
VSYALFTTPAASLAQHQKQQHRILALSALAYAVYISIYLFTSLLSATVSYLTMLAPSTIYLQPVFHPSQCSPPNTVISHPIASLTINPALVPLLLSISSHYTSLQASYTHKNPHTHLQTHLHSSQTLLTNHAHPTYYPPLT